MALETERKYESQDKRPLPRLTDLPGVISVDEPQLLRLRATYFDTADLRLAQHGITLRRRTGGDDAGWHLKLPVDSDTRAEIREPAGRASTSVPASLLAKVLAYSRAAPLLPVAQINTARRRQRLLDDDGGAIAELAADSVTARTLDALGEPASVLRWREIEVELANGDRGLLNSVDELLTADGFVRSTAGSKLAHLLGGRLPHGSPATPSQRGKGGLTAGDVLLSYARAQVEALMTHDAKARTDEHDAVHQMRVATRRLRSVLRQFGSLVERDAAQSMDVELRWLAGVLGEVRDIEVLRQQILDEIDGLLAELVIGPVRERVTFQLDSEYDSARARLLDAMASERYFALFDRLDAFVGSPPFTEEATRPASDVVPDPLRRSWRRVTRRASEALDQRRGVATGGQPEGEGAGTGIAVDLHNTRKAMKRVRYVLEAVRPAVSSRVRRVGRRLTQIQDVLGAYQDSVVTREVIQRLSGDARSAGEDTFTYGVLYQSELDRGQRAVDEFGPFWTKAARKIARRLP